MRICCCVPFRPVSLTLRSRVDSELSASKSSFALQFGTILWTLTTGLQFAIGWWYGRSAVFYLPPAWLGPFTWWLSFPFAPAGELGQSLVLWFIRLLSLLGSVSCGVWQMACRRVIKVFERVVKESMSQLPQNLTCVPVDHCLGSDREQGPADQSRTGDSTDTSKKSATPQTKS